MSRNHEHIQLVKREHSPSTGFYLPVYKLDMAEDDEPNTLGRTFIRPVVPALGVGTATGIARFCKKSTLPVADLCDRNIGRRIWRCCWYSYSNS